jgi:hypothetical protein
VSRSGVNVCVEREHVARLDRLAAMKGVSRSVVVGAALTAYLAPEGGGHCEAATARRLERLGRQLGRLERGQTLVIETLAFFIRDYLAGTAPVLEPHEQAVRARGRARFGQFIEQLARHLQRDGSFVRELEQEFAPDRSRFPPLSEESFAGPPSPKAPTNNDQVHCD